MITHATTGWLARLDASPTPSCIDCIANYVIGHGLNGRQDGKIRIAKIDGVAGRSSCIWHLQKAI